MEPKRRTPSPNPTQPSLACNSRPTLIRLGSHNVPNRVFWAVRTTISVPRQLGSSFTSSRRFGPPAISMLHFPDFGYWVC